MSVTRWEDDASVWTGPSYVDQRIGYHPDVGSAPVAGRIITCVDVVDWESFSAFRQRVTAMVSPEGVSWKKTSDGAPHLTVARESAFSV